MKNSGRFERSTWFSVFIVAAFFLVFVGGGAVYLFLERREAIEEKGRELTGLSNLKVEQIRGWRQERMSDARYILNSRNIALEVSRLSVRRTNRDTMPPPMDWMQSMFANGHYASIQVVSPSRQRLATTSRDVPSLHIHDRTFRQAYASREVVLEDLDRGDDGKMHMHLFVPVLDPQRPRSEPPIAVVVFEIDPEMELFRLTNSWPIPSRTSEVVLYRIDGDSVRRLNTPSGAAIDAFPDRIPVWAAELPGAWGARGNSGLFSGRDYRGVEVLAHIQQVPSSPWHIVAKIDRVEALGRVNEQVVLVGLVVVLGLALSFGGVYVLRAEARRSAAEERLRSEVHLAAIRRHHDDLMRDANDIIILSDADDRIVDVNRMAATVYGYHESELIGKSMRLIEPENASMFDDPLETLRTKGSDRFESVHRSKDGRSIDAEVSARLLTVEGRSYIQRIIRNTTDRKAAEREILRLNRFYRMLTSVNRLLVHERDGKILLEESCRLAVSEGGFILVWVATYDDERGSLVPVTSTGPAQEYFAEIVRSEDPASLFEGPVARLIRSGQHTVCDDYRTDELRRPYRTSAERFGIRSSAAFPIVVNGTTWGVISFYSSEPSFFSEEEVALLDDLAADLSFALETIRTAESRNRLEYTLANKELTYRALFENSGEAIFLTKPDGSIVSANPAACRMVGRTEEEILRLGRSGIVDPDDNRLAAALEQRSQSGQFSGELRCRRADGTTFPAYVTSTFFTLPSGDRMTSTIIRDISDQKNYEREINRIANELNKAQEYSHVGSWSVNVDTRDMSWSDEMFRIFGIDKESWKHRTKEALWNAIHPEDRKVLENAKIAIRAGRRPEPAGFRIVRPSGAIRHVWAESGSYLQDEDGGPKVLVGFLQDMTDRVIQEQALQDREASLRQAQSIARLGTWALELDGRITWSQVLYEVYGMPNEFKPDRDFFVRSIAPRDRPRVEAWIQDWFSGHSPGDLSYQIVRPDGMVRYLHARGDRICDSTGKVIRLTGVTQDVTDSYLAQEAIRHQDELLRDVGNIAQVGGWEFDAVTLTGTWTDEVARIHDLDPSDPTNVQKGMSFYVGESRARIESAVARAIQDGIPYDLELEMVTAVGRRKWVRTIGRPILEGGKVVRVRGSFQDITERKKADETLQSQLEELRRWHKVSLDREMRILSLKGEINELLAKLGLPPRYESVGEEGH